MLKAVQNLVRDARTGAISARYGNHSFERKDGFWYFRYHGAPVCIVDISKQTVSFSCCGYEGSSSTQRTVNSYVTAFSSLREVMRES